MATTLSGGQGTDTLLGGTKYAMQGVRRQPLNAKLTPVLATAAMAAGVDDIRVVSGGQPPKGSGQPRKGSVRHDHGMAGDIQLVVDGRTLDFDNPADRPIVEKFITTAVAAGATGVGAAANYMGTKTIHVGFGAPGAWGARGRTANAPAWLKAAFDAGIASPIAVDPNAVVAFEQGGYPRDPFGVAASKEAPQDAQSAIASLMAPTGGPPVPDMPTAAMGYAPNLPGGMPPAPPQMPQVAQAPAGPPMPAMPPQWAISGGFPIDEGLSGQSADAVLMGGPRMDPRRAGPATGPMPPDMGSMRSPADVLAAGPNLRPPIDVPMPTPPQRPTGPGIFQRNAMSGAPDAGMVPTPPSRASGLPSPPQRPDINDPSLSFNAPPYQGGGPTGGPPMPPGLESMVAGRPEFPGTLPGAPRTGDMSAAMGNAPPAPSLSPPTPEITPAFIESLGLAEDMNRTREDSEFWTGALQPQASPPWGPTVAGRPEFPGGGMPPAEGPFFDSAEPGRSLPPSWSTGAFPAPPAPTGTVEAGSTGGEFFTPAPPMPTPPPPNMMADRFSDAFSPGGGGQIMDLQTAFDQRNAPPTMNAQDGINSIFGAPPVQAAPSNLAIPFAEVPGFGVPQANAAPISGPIPMPQLGDRTNLPARFDDAFAGGSVVQPPTPGVTPGVVAGEMPQPGAPMDIRPPIQGGPPMPAPTAMASPVPTPPPAPRQTSTGAGQGKGIVGRILGGLLGGPLGAMGGGLLAGGGGGGFGFGGQPSFTATGGSGTAPYGNSGGSTTYQKGTSNALGGSNALTWKTSNGGTITAYTDPNTGQTFHSYG